MPLAGAKVIIELIQPDDGDVEAQANAALISALVEDRLESFKFTDKDTGKDSAELVFRNDDYLMLDMPVFTKGMKLLMTWGWDGQMAMPRRMIVMKVRGGDMITVTCHCTLALLDKKKRARNEVFITDSEFVRIVAKDHGYTGVLADIEETSEMRDSITQKRRSTDARMLHQLARRNGFVFYMDASGLHWHRRRTDLDPVKTYWYRTDPGRGDILAPPRIEANLSRAVAQVKVLARDPIRKGAPIEVTADDSNAGDTALGNENEFGDPNETMSQREERITRIDERSAGLASEAEAQAEAAARYRNTAKGRYKMGLDVIGDARVGAKEVVDVWNVSDLFDGLYYIKECVHTVDNGGFRQELSLIKDSLREVKAGKKSQRKGKRNKNISDKDKKYEVLQNADYELTAKMEFELGPNGEAIPRWRYYEKGEATGWTRDLSVEEINQIKDDDLAFIASTGTTSLPDQ